MKTWLALGTALAVVMLVGCQPDPDFAAVGQTVPDKPVEDFAHTGKSVSPRDFKGKAVLIDFWATWCGPCRKFMPTVRGLYDEYHDKGLEVMCVTDEARATVADFRKSQGETLPAYLDEYEILHKAFGVEAIPRISVIDRNGNVLYLGDADARAVTKAVEQAIGSST